MILNLQKNETIEGIIVSVQKKELKDMAFDGQNEITLQKIDGEYVTFDADETLNLMITRQDLGQYVYIKYLGLDTSDSQVVPRYVVDYE